MAFKDMFDKRRKRKKEFMSHVSKEVQDRIKKTGTPVTWEEWQSFTGNSYERALLHPLMDNVCFINAAAYAMKQSSIRELGRWELTDHYNDSVERIYFPGLLNRLRIILYRQDWLEDILELYEECYDIDDDKEARAKARKAAIVYPGKNQIQIDIDTEKDWERFTQQLTNLEVVLQTHIDSDDFKMDVKESASGGEHRHVTLTLPFEIKSEWMRVALQFALCSDFKRESLGAFRLMVGQEKVSCFFEKEEK